MRNNDLIYKNLNNALKYLTEQETKLQPLISKAQDVLLDKISQDELSVHEAFDMFSKLQEQYTNSILLITKIQEIIDFKG